MDESHYSSLHIPLPGQYANWHNFSGLAAAVPPAPPLLVGTFQDPGGAGQVIG